MTAFKIGDSVSYPAHGVGSIKRIERRVMGGGEVFFFVVQISRSGATLMIPVLQAAGAGLRAVADEAAVAEILRVLSSDADPDAVNRSWNRRFRELNDKLRGDSITAVAEVLRDVWNMRRKCDLSYGEKKMLDKATSLLAEEISAARGVSTDEAERLIFDALPS